MSLYFHSKNPETSWLSNFSPHRFTLNGQKWRSVEHYYQACKFDHPEIVSLIQKSATGAEAAKIGRKNQGEVRSDWDTQKMKVMKTALDAKFTQNRKILEWLIATGTQPLVHESNHDAFWGQNREGEGANQLGKLLMTLRSELA